MLPDLMRLKELIKRTIIFSQTKYMILKTKCPRTAIMTSYKRPVLYKEFVLLDGAVVVKFR